MRLIVYIFIIKQNEQVRDLHCMQSLSSLVCLGIFVNTRSNMMLAVFWLVTQTFAWIVEQCFDCHYVILWCSVLSLCGPGCARPLLYMGAQWGMAQLSFKVVLHILFLLSVNVNSRGIACLRRRGNLAMETQFSVIGLPLFLNFPSELLLENVAKGYIHIHTYIYTHIICNLTCVLFQSAFVLYPNVYNVF